MNKREISDLLDLMRTRKLRIATAESLTCGLIGANLTKVPGASSVVKGGFLVYTNEMKTKLLGVPADILAQFTAVSEPVAHRMAEGALLRADTDVAVAVTGYAASPGKEADASQSGLVYIGLAYRDKDFAAQGPKTQVFRHQFSGNRDQVRQKTVNTALRHVRDLLLKTQPSF